MKETPAATFSRCAPDAQARARFEEIIKQRAKALRPGASRSEAYHLAKMVADLARELAGWTQFEAVGELPAYGPEAYSGAKKREYLLYQLRHPLGVIHPWWQVELAQALSALDLADVKPLLEPAPSKRQGAHPRAVAEAELEILCWIRFRRGLGHKVSIATAEAAAAVSLTTKAVEAWPRALGKIWSREAVQACLGFAEHYGKFRAEIEEAKDSGGAADQEVAALALMDRYYGLGDGSTSFSVESLRDTLAAGGIDFHLHAFSSKTIEQLAETRRRALRGE